MSPRERVLAALKREEPDRVPFCEFGTSRRLMESMLDWKREELVDTDFERNQYTVDEAKAISSYLGIDCIACILRAPVFADKNMKDGQLFYGAGQIRTEADLGKVDLPDPHRDELYAEAEQFAAEKGDYAAAIVTRAGFFPTLLSMGFDVFGVSIYENRQFVETLLNMYCGWAETVVERTCQLDFDVLITTDDMAFKTGLFASPEFFREMVFPRFRRIISKANIPWIHHSDGNIELLIPDFIELGVSGLHPFEKGAIDIREAKRRYGDQICILGNVDLNILGNGTAEDVDTEVRDLIRDLGPGGGYMITSGNSLAPYLKQENVRAFAQAVRTYGAYPITL